jgi:hypothetical protein
MQQTVSPETKDAKPTARTAATVLPLRARLERRRPETETAVVTTREGKHADDHRRAQAGR